MLIGMELVKELVETVLLTGRVKGHTPKSLLLIATPESGKTRVFLETPCSCAHMLSDVTGKGIQDLCKGNAEKTHFVINDLVAVLSHRQTVNKYTLSMINAITEEGIIAVAYPGSFESFKSGKRGIIAALTTSMTRDGRQWWNKIGLTSRMIPFCYDHGDELVIKIKTAIRNGESGLAPQTFQVPPFEGEVDFSAKLKLEFPRISDAKSLELKEKGLRRLQQFLALACAHAVRRSPKRATVTDADVEFLKRIYPYMDYTRPGVL